MNQNKESNPGRRVLLVDDDEAYHLLVPDVLKEHGHEVDIASSVPGALGHLAMVARGEAPRPDAVLLDYHLDHTGGAVQGTTGDIVQRAVREQLGDVPIIGFSGRTMDTHGVSDLHADATKDGLFDLPQIIADLPPPQPPIMPPQGPPQSPLQ